MIQRLIVY